MADVVVAGKEAAPLDELMLAMDVVDTLRHRELMLAREVEADERDEALLGRLREIYAGQGLDVTDEILAEGVRALREERFVYTGPEPSLARTLATLYVTRSRWGKWAGALAGAAIVAVLVFQLAIRGPALRAYEELPSDLQLTYQAIAAATDDASALSDARALVAAGEAAVDRRELEAARASLADLRDLETLIGQEYELTIVSRPGELSGVWRVPDANRDAQNFYLIVEALTPEGRALTLPITSEEDGTTRRVSKWGVRVDESTFQRIASDKNDDGIIQQSVVGRKARGAVEPEYSVATTGAAITEW